MGVHLQFIVIVGLTLSGCWEFGKVQGKSVQVQEDKSGGVCETEGCKRTAERLLNSLNRSVDPCEDFYEYSCGNWMKNNPRPSTSSRWNQFSIIAKQLNDHIQEIVSSQVEEGDVSALVRVKKFYSACINLDAINNRGLKSLAKVVREFGGFPLIEGGNWKSMDFALDKILGRLRRNFGLSLLVEVSVRPDMKNTDRNVVYFDQPEFFLPRDILLDPIKFQGRHDAYRKFAHEAIVELNDQEMNSGTPLDKDLLRSRIDEMIQFEMRLANVSATGEERRIVDNVYHPFNLESLEKIQKTSDSNVQTNMSWMVMLGEMFVGKDGVSEDERIIVLQPEYLKRLRDILTETPKEVVANYVQWRVMSSLLGETTDRMRQIQFEFTKVMTGLKEPETREAKCSEVDLSSQYYLLGYGVGVKYLDKYFPAETKDNVNELVGYLRGAFESLLQESDWMDEPTKAKAMHKIKSMRQFIAYPDWMKNATAVDEYFHELEVKDDHFENHLSYLRWESHKGLRILRQPPKRDEMDSHPVYVNAMYSPEVNSITFPAGILASPFYSQGSPASINFGGIGVVIGHEITHGFDDEGSQYDDKGNAENWWSAAIKEEFNRRAKCMIDEYSSFHTDHGNVNGALTAGENIADNGGLHEAFKGYQEWLRKRNGGQEELVLPGLEDLTPTQLFFLGFSTIWCVNSSPEAEQNHLLTDVHSPGRFRVLGVLQNSESFADAFKCPKNSPMNPDKKCKLW